MEVGVGASAGKFTGVNESGITELSSVFWVEETGEIIEWDVQEVQAYQRRKIIREITGETIARNIKMLQIFQTRNHHPQTPRNIITRNIKIFKITKVWEISKISKPISGESDFPKAGVGEQNRFIRAGWTAEAVFGQVDFGEVGMKP